MRHGYDSSRGVLGKHFEAYRAGTNVVFLDPDVAKGFGDSASVNQVLHLLLEFARTNVPETGPAVSATYGASRRTPTPGRSRPARG